MLLRQTEVSFFLLFPKDSGISVKFQLSLIIFGSSGFLLHRIAMGLLELGLKISPKKALSGPDSFLQNVIGKGNLKIGTLKQSFFAIVKIVPQGTAFICCYPST